MPGGLGRASLGVTALAAGPSAAGLMSRATCGLPADEPAEVAAAASACGAGAAGPSVACSGSATADVRAPPAALRGTARAATAAATVPTTLWGADGAPVVASGGAPPPLPPPALLASLPSSGTVTLSAPPPRADTADALLLPLPPDGLGLGVWPRPPPPLPLCPAAGGGGGVCGACVASDVRHCGRGDRGAVGGRAASGGASTADAPAAPACTTSGLLPRRTAGAGCSSGPGAWPRERPVDRRRAPGSVHLRHAVRGTEPGPMQVRVV